MGDHAAVRRHSAAQSGKNLGSDLLAIGGRIVFEAAEDRTFLVLVLVDKLAHFVDGADAVQIALALSLAPGEQAMAAQQNAFRTRVLPDGIFEHESQFEAGTLPRQPNDLTVELAVELVELALSVGTCGQRNGPVGMKVVDVVIGDERMEGCVNGCRYPILAECRQRVVTHHFVLVLFAAIKLFQLRPDGPGRATRIPTP